MRDVTQLIRLVVVQRNLADETVLADKLIDNLVNTLLDQSFKARGKACHIAIPNLCLNFRGALYTHLYSTRRDPMSPMAAARPQSVKTSTQLRSNRDKQVLQFIEPETNVSVKIVGVMHYNPASNQLVEETIEKLADNDKLGSVIIETCDVRWKNVRREYSKQMISTMASQDDLGWFQEAINPWLDMWERSKRRFLFRLLSSEMRTAHDLAVSYKRPVVLGDQRVDVTVSRLKAALNETLIDLPIPIQGWQRIVRNITKTLNDVVPLWGDDYLNPSAFFDLAFLSGAPVSIFKGALSPLLNSPAQTLSFLGLLILIWEAGDLTEDQLTWKDYLGSCGIAIFSFAAFTRIILKALLQERNEILALSILEQCRQYQRKKGPPRQSAAANGDAYASNLPSNSGCNDVTVVAVLGLVHCNGVMKLLKERHVDRPLLSGTRIHVDDSPDRGY